MCSLMYTSLYRPTSVTFFDSYRWVRKHLKISKFSLFKSLKSSTWNKHAIHSYETYINLWNICFQNVNQTCNFRKGGRLSSDETLFWKLVFYHWLLKLFTDFLAVSDLCFQTPQIYLAGQKHSEKSNLCCVFFSRYSVLSTKLHPVPAADINQSIDMHFRFYYRQELWFPLTRSDTEMNSNFHRSAGGAFSFKYRTDR